MLYLKSLQLIQGYLMSKEAAGNLIVIRPSDISLKPREIAEKIISKIMNTGELDVIGVNDAMFLSCAAVEMAIEIANIFINEICVDTFEVPLIGKIDLVSIHLCQNKTIDFAKLAETEEKQMPQLYGQTISVGRENRLEQLLTLSLMKLSHFDKLKIMGAGGAINESVTLALKLTSGKISKEKIGVKLIHLYSIDTRADATRKVVAMSIYLRKGLNTEYSKKHTDLLEKLKGGI